MLAELSSLVRKSGWVGSDNLNVGIALVALAPQRITDYNQVIIHILTIKHVLKSWSFVYQSEDVSIKDSDGIKDFSFRLLNSPFDNRYTATTVKSPDSELTVQSLSSRFCSSLNVCFKCATDFPAFIFDLICSQVFLELSCCICVQKDSDALTSLRGWLRLSSGVGMSHGIDQSFNVAPSSFFR